MGSGDFPRLYFERLATPKLYSASGSLLDK